MLQAHLLRVAPGRPDAQLGTVTVIPMRREGRFSVHVAQQSLDGRGLMEQHVDVDEWDATRPPLDLLAHALNLARSQRELRADGVQAVVVPAELAAQLCKVVLAIADRETQPVPDDELVEDCRALLTQVLDAGHVDAR